MKDLNITDSAAEKVAELILEEENLELKLRLFITGGGCSGFQYGFTFDENINSDDSVVTKEVSIMYQEKEYKVEVKLLVDSMSYQYLSKAEVDYKDDLDGAQFIIRNPDAKTTCGCGSSFSVE